MKISAFVLMPFDKESQDRYELAIKSACKSLKIKCSRVDEQIFQENILERIFAQISSADIIIADMTGVNPNVFFETGYAKALGKKILFITNEAASIPFDLKHYPHIIYSNSLISLKNSLIKNLSFYIKEITIRNFKVDTNVLSGAYDTRKWVIEKIGGTIESIFARTDFNSHQDLVNRLELAKNHFTSFGLTRNYYVSDIMFDLIKRKALQIPVKIFLMNPHCDSRKDRYRIEPMEAAMEDPQKYKNNIESKYVELITEINHNPAKAKNAGIKVYHFNFPCSFAIEEIDDYCRVMLYGHNKRGTDSPIFVFKSKNPYYEYFISQLRWVEQIADSDIIKEPWKSKKIEIKPIENDFIT
jgi:hypothetical protein